MNSFGIGERTFHEILSLEFVKTINSFTLSQKAQIFSILANSDIEASNVLKSCHAVVASTLEAWAQIGLDLETPPENLEMPEGLYSGQQQKFIKAAYQDIKGFQQHFETQASTIKLLNSGQATNTTLQKNQLADLAKLQSHFNGESFKTVLELCWSFLVFTS